MRSAKMIQNGQMTAGSMSNVPSVLVSPVYATPSPLAFPSHILTPKPAGWVVAVPQLIIWLRRRPNLGRAGWGIHWASFSHGTQDKSHGNGIVRWSSQRITQRYSNWCNMRRLQLLDLPYAQNRILPLTTVFFISKIGFDVGLPLENPSTFGF
jgi:hypothetical protein